MEYMVYRYNLTLWDIIGIILYIITLYPSPWETIYPGYLLSRQGMESVLLTFYSPGYKIVKSKLIDIVTKEVFILIWLQDDFEEFV